MTARPVVLAAPSGTGKTTIARRLVSDEPDFVFSLSATTRAPREGEVDGVDYHFVEAAEFRRMIEAGEFAEWADVHGRYYGTPRANLLEAAGRGEYVLLDIDVQGAEQIARSVPQAVRIFILPPDAPSMFARLRGRGTETEADVERRLQSALDELARIREFEWIVVNDDLDRATAQVRAIGRGEEVGQRPEEEQERIDELRRDIQAELLRMRAAGDQG